MRRSVAAFHIGRQIIATEPYRSLIFSEVRPGAHVVEEEEIRGLYSPGCRHGLSSLRHLPHGRGRQGGGR